MNDFDAEPDEFSQRVNAAVADLQADAGLEERIIGNLPGQRGIYRIPGTDRPFVRRALVAAAATVLVGATGIVGMEIFGPPPKQDREVASAQAVSTRYVQKVPNNLKQLGTAIQPLYPMASALPAATFGIAAKTESTAEAAPVGLEVAATPLPGAIPVIPSAGENRAAGKYKEPMLAENLAGQLELGNKLAGRRVGGFGGGGMGGGGVGGGRGGVFRANDSLKLPTDEVAVADAAKDIPAPLAASVAPAQKSAQLADRKIMRTGEMEFEVESFDAANERLHKIVQQCGGYIGATDSQRQPNGKVRGSVTVRVPPENLDMLVMMLRALGDLKRQQVSAQDITKEYTDLQSELRAAKAMEDRLLEIIKTANAQVKDLLAVEKELATWREKDEQITGQINYYNNMVSLSTLTITLTEKDIGQAAVAQETQAVNAGLEADDVSRARDEIFKAVDAAKGRIVQADLSAREAGQYTATIVATLPPDSAGAVIDRLHQLGRVTRLESALRQTTTGEPAAPGMTVKRHETVLNLSIYNVAAYAARTTDNLSVGCDDVETSYHTLLDYLAKSDRARVINSNLARPTPDTATGVVVFEIPEAGADAALAFLRASGTVLQLNVTENPESANVTTTKRAFVVTLNPLATIAPQETDALTLLPAAGDVRAAYSRLLDFAAQPGSHARVVDKNLQQENGVYTSASIVMEVPRLTLDRAELAIVSAGKVVARKATRQPDSPNVVDSKVLFQFSFVNVDALQPRQTLNRDIAVGDVPGAYQAILDAAKSAGAKILDAQLNVQPGQKTTAEMQIDLPADKQGAFERTLAPVGVAVGGTMSRAPDTDATTEAKVRLHLTLAQMDELAPRRSYQLQVQAAAPQTAADDISTAAVAAGGRVAQRTTNTDPDGRATTDLVLDVPLSQASAISQAALGKGTLLQDHSTEDPQAPAGAAARANLEIQFASEPSVVADNDGLVAAIKQGLVTSVRGLLWSLEMLVIGLFLIGPWGLVVWLGWKWFKRGRGMTR